MLHHKALHRSGLDTLIYRTLKDTSFKNNYYLFIYDYCFARNTDTTTFYNDVNNTSNTWNFELDFSSTLKTSIMNDSVLFNFADYSANPDRDNVVVKAISHCDVDTKYGQSHIVDNSLYYTKYDTSKYINQRILRTDSKYNVELNVFVIRDLNTRELHLPSVLLTNDTTIHINRKQSKITAEKCDIYNILGDKVKDLIDYINYIKLDYGRIELLKDEHIGWCIIDVNNSPGGGPLSNLMYKDLSMILSKTLI
jgi:hypothetical protein